jgi:hypothetical protein
VLLHTGSLKTISAEPPDYFGIALYMHILPGRDSYIGTKRGTMRSRNWSEHDVTLKLDVRTLAHACANYCGSRRTQRLMSILNAHACDETEIRGAAGQA